MSGAAPIGRGTHVIAELRGVSARKLDDEPWLRTAFVDILALAGATVCDVTSKRFDPHGVTVLALLSESHASLHTYPEHEALFADFFTCGTTADPLVALKLLIRELEPRQSDVRTLDRCIEPLIRS
jgi:S-adenosylmethionine decarboxylase